MKTERCLVQLKREAYFPEVVKQALSNIPPGSWMSAVPEGCIRLNSGYPAANLVPSTELKEATDRLLTEEQDLPLHYIGSPRIDQLKTQLIERMNERKMEVQEDEVLVTSGACQAIDLIARILLDENAFIIVESPTYMEALEIFQNYTKNIITIPIDADGLDTKQLEGILIERTKKEEPLPKLLYTIPTFQNPTGTTLSFARREKLIKLAKEYDFLILEDDAYGELAFGESPTTLKSLDEEDRVFYVGSLSKIVAPGMRIGWIAAHSEWIEALFWFKKDLEHPFAQSLMSAYLEKVNLAHRSVLLTEKYEEKAVILYEALIHFMPEGVKWYRPEGGYFMWIEVPGVDTTAMLAKAKKAGVAYVPGQYFFLHQDEGKSFLRLSFSYASKEEIKKGIEILSHVVAEEINK